MLWYPLLLVVHFLGLIGLFGYFTLYTRAGGRLRPEPVGDEAELWIRVLDDARPMLSGGGAMLLASGVILAALRWRGPFPFVAVGLATLLVVWIVGAMVARSQVRAMRAAERAVRAEAVRRPLSWIVMTALNGAVLGVLLVMTIKPSWAWSIGLVIAGAALAAAAMAAIMRRQPRVATA